MKYLSLTIVFMFCVAEVSAQSASQVVILYKDYPYLVNLDSAGEITEFVRTAPEVMQGQSWNKDQVMPMPIGPYTRKSNSDVALEEYISPLNNSGGTGDDVAAVVETKDSQAKVLSATPSAETPDSPAKVVDSSNTVNVIANNAVASTPAKREMEKTKVIYRDQERVEANYYLKFQGFSARLTAALTEQLRDISNDYKDNPVGKVVINSYVTEGDETNRELAENRMEACRDLLETFGVPASKFVTELKSYRSDVPGNVSIDFQN